MDRPGLAKAFRRPVDFDATALEIATLIHTNYRNSYWAQNELLIKVREELARLDREYQETMETQLPLFQSGGVKEGGSR